MPTHAATGTFQVTLTPHGDPDLLDGVSLGLMQLSKTFDGDLVGTGSGRMLSAMSATPGSAGYVAIERVSGTLGGRSGSFVFQHTGSMDRGAPALRIAVVPDSGTGELAGLAGQFTLEVVDGVHHYRFDYSLP